jgi:NADPH-dependent curcumin reductase CurA
MAGPSNYMRLLVARAPMEGFVIMDYLPHFAEAIMQLATWRNEGELVLREHIIEGLEQFPEAFNMLFTGENQGKLMIRV